MPFQLDHVVIAVADLARAVQDYRTLGFTVLEGGVHASGATHNALVVFSDGTYLELLASTGVAPSPETLDFSLMLTHGEGLCGFALRADNLSALVPTLRGRGVQLSDLIAGARRKPDGSQLAWQLALVNNGFLPFFIEDMTPRPLRVPDDPALTVHANGVRGIGGIELVVPDLAAAQTRYQTLLGVQAEPEDMPAFRAFALQGAQLVISAPQPEIAELVISWSTAPLAALESEISALFNTEVPLEVQALMQRSGQLWQQYEAEIKRQIAERAAYLAQRGNVESLYAVRLRQASAERAFPLADLVLTHNVRFTLQTPD
ncbi:MAG: VOC family protein [Anaerolineae bacterium]|nr:VOC family protein [Anaerolineae bacterium]